MGYINIWRAGLARNQQFTWELAVPLHGKGGKAELSLQPLLRASTCRRTAATRQAPALQGGQGPGLQVRLGTLTWCPRSAEGGVGVLRVPAAPLQALGPPAHPRLQAGTSLTELPDSAPKSKFTAWDPVRGWGGWESGGMLAEGYPRTGYCPSVFPIPDPRNEEEGQDGGRDGDGGTSSTEIATWLPQPAGAWGAHAVPRCSADAAPQDVTGRGASSHPTPNQTRLGAGAAWMHQEPLIWRTRERGWCRGLAPGWRGLASGAGPEQPQLGGAASMGPWRSPHHAVASSSSSCPATAPAPRPRSSPTSSPSC